MDAFGRVLVVYTWRADNIRIIFVCKAVCYEVRQYEVEERGGGNYQTMLNDALRSYMEHQDQPLEEVIRRIA